MFFSFGIFAAEAANAVVHAAFPPDAVVDLTQPPYNAVPDDGLDDSAAIQQAITDHVGSRRHLYLPPGTYHVAKPLVAKGPEGKWRPFLVIRGAGRNETILRVPDNAPAFADPANPAAVLATGSEQEAGDNPNGGGNKAFGNFVLDLTVDTGRGNPGAVGIDWAVSNFGAIRNVTLRTGEGSDGAGVAGIRLTRQIPGPGMIHNVYVSGFDVGIDVGDIQYGLTLDDVVLSGQHVAGVRTDINLLHVRGLLSVNAVPAVVVTERPGALTLLNSRLINTAGGPVVESAGTTLIRGLQSRDAQSVKTPAGVTAVGTGGQVVWPEPPGDAAAEQPLIEPRAMLELPIHPLSDWQPVGPREPGEQDDTAAIQRALDAGKPVVYFPGGRTFFLSDTVVVRGNVRQIHGFGAEISLGAAKEPFSDIDNPRPLFRIDPTDHQVLLVEHLFFNAQYPGQVLFENNRPGTLVLRHLGGWVGLDGHRRAYRNTPAAHGSEIYIEDAYLPGWHFTNQRVWARQFNPENYDGDGSTPQVTNEGGTLWVLGFKTEGPAPFIATTDGGTTELLGAYNYVSASANVPAGSVPYIVDNATAALTFTTENFGERDYAVYIRQIDGDEVHEWRPDDLPARGNHPDSRAVPLWRSR